MLLNTYEIERQFNMNSKGLDREWEIRMGEELVKKSSGQERELNERTLISDAKNNSNLLHV